MLIRVAKSLKIIAFQPILEYMHQTPPYASCPPCFRSNLFAIVEGMYNTFSFLPDYRPAGVIGVQKGEYREF